MDSFNTKNFPFLPIFAYMPGFLLSREEWCNNDDKDFLAHHGEVMILKRKLLIIISWKGQYLKRTVGKLCTNHCTQKQPRQFTIQAIPGESYSHSQAYSPSQAFTEVLGWKTKSSKTKRHQFCNILAGGWA